MVLAASGAGMNLVEGLSRQIARVAEMKEGAERMVGHQGVNMAFYIAACNQAIEEGHQAMGSGDILRMATAHDELKEIN